MLHIKYFRNLNCHCDFPDLVFSDMLPNVKRRYLCRRVDMLVVEADLSTITTVI